VKSDRFLPLMELLRTLMLESVGRRLRMQVSCLEGMGRLIILQLKLTLSRALPWSGPIR
jgi:hypothetical protein